MNLTRLSEVWDELSELAQEEHVIALGATPVTNAYSEVFEQWLANGYAGTMQYLHRHAQIRRDPLQRYPWANSAIAIAVPYSAERPTDDSIAAHTARYALGDDYHEVLDEILRKFELVLNRHTTVKTWRYVDTGPLSDRTIAAMSGLGWIGRNAMLVNENHGSWFFIGVLLTSLECDVEPDRVVDRCGTCTRCVDACPTDAILPDRTVDSNLCISHATIEQRGVIANEMKAQLGMNLFGCDICQEVCPWNRKAPEAHPRFAMRDEYRATPITDLLKLDQSGFSQLFRKSAIKRAKRTGLLRNAIVMSNPSEEDLAAVADETDPGVLDALTWQRSGRT